MQLTEIDSTTEDTFFRCLHLEKPADYRVMEMRREWRENFKPKGHRGKVLKDDDGQIVGLTNYIPIEYSPFIGERLMSILCIWIHGFDHLIGNQQSRGYGRYMLACIEEDARVSGYGGVTAWGKDFPHWNPISFYEHMGYKRVDKSGWDVLVWKPFHNRVQPPRLPKRVKIQAVDSPTGHRVHLTTVSHDWCNSCSTECIMARDASVGLHDKVKLTETRADYGSGISMQGGIFQVLYVDGEPFRPDGPPPSADEFRQMLLDRYEKKNR